jgi:hypothetical protein
VDKAKGARKKLREMNGEGPGRVGRPSKQLNKGPEKIPERTILPRFQETASFHSTAAVHLHESMAGSFRLNPASIHIHDDPFQRSIDELEVLPINSGGVSRAFLTVVDNQGVGLDSYPTSTDSPDKVFSECHSD